MAAAAFRCACGYDPSVSVGVMTGPSAIEELDKGIADTKVQYPRAGCRLAFASPVGAEDGNASRV
jgi:hypothetical protein